MFNLRSCAHRILHSSLQCVAKPKSKHVKISMPKSAVLAAKPICRQTCAVLYGRFPPLAPLSNHIPLPFLSCALLLKQPYHNLLAYCGLCSETCKRVTLSADYCTFCLHNKSLGLTFFYKQLELFVGFNCHCASFIFFHVVTRPHL